jgi:Fe2+ transport protein
MRRSIGLAAGAVLALALSGCADMGAHVASSSGSASGASASGASASGASASGMSASHASAAMSGGAASVPAGVAAQYSILQEEVAANGGQTTSGPWRIAYIVEAAEPWYEPRGEKMFWRTPKPGETHHIEIIPIEKSTGRIMPETPITVQVLDQSGAVVDQKSLNFYYTDFFHYANNFEVPKPGTYTLKARIGAPTFFRHADPGQPAPMAQGTTVTFDGVRLTPSG